MPDFLEDFSKWPTEALVTAPPESFEAAERVGLIIELQDRLREEVWRYEQLQK